MQHTLEQCDESPSRHLTKLYIVALGLTALLAILGQVFVHHALVGPSRHDELTRNSPETEQLFAEIEPEFQTILAATKELVAAETSGDSDPARRRAAYRPIIAKILSAESSFLKGMNQIVTQYEQEAKASIVKLDWLNSFQFALIARRHAMTATTGIGLTSFLCSKPTCI